MKQIKGYLSIFSAIQIGLVIALLLFWWPFIKTEKIFSKVPFETVVSEMSAELDPTLYPPQDNQEIRRYLGVDPQDYEDIAFFRSDDAMSAQEMVIARSDNREVLAEFEKAMNERWQSQYNIYEGYAPEQASLAQRAVVDVQGNYALYFVGEDTAGMKQQFIQLLKGE